VFPQQHCFSCEKRIVFHVRTILGSKHPSPVAITPPPKKEYIYMYALPHHMVEELVTLRRDGDTATAAAGASASFCNAAAAAATAATAATAAAAAAAAANVSSASGRAKRVAAEAQVVAERERWRQRVASHLQFA